MANAQLARRISVREQPGLAETLDADVMHTALAECVAALGEWSSSDYRAEGSGRSLAIFHPCIQAGSRSAVGAALVRCEAICRWPRGLRGAAPTIARSTFRSRCGIPKVGGRTRGSYRARIGAVMTVPSLSIASHWCHNLCGKDGRTHYTSTMWSWPRSGSRTALAIDAAQLYSEALLRQVRRRWLTRQHCLSGQGQSGTSVP